MTNIMDKSLVTSAEDCFCVCRQHWAAYSTTDHLLD